MRTALRALPHSAPVALMFENDVVLVERQLSSAERRVTSDIVTRLGEVILQKLRSEDPVLRQGYARRFIAQVIVAPKLITITGPVKSLETASCRDPKQIAPVVPSSARNVVPHRGQRWALRSLGNFNPA